MYCTNDLTTLQHMEPPVGWRGQRPLLGVWDNALKLSFNGEIHIGWVPKHCLKNRPIFQNIGRFIGSGGGDLISSILSILRFLPIFGQNIGQFFSPLRVGRFQKKQSTKFIILKNKGLNPRYPNVLSWLNLFLSPLDFNAMFSNGRRRRDLQPKMLSPPSTMPDVLDTNADASTQMPTPPGLSDVDADAVRPCRR